MSAATPKPWTKSDRKRAWTALDGWRLMNGSVSQRAEVPVEPELQVLAAVRHLKMLRGLYVDRAQSNRDTARHFEANPTIYGDTTPEMVKRFDDLAVEEDKGIAALDKLVARLEAEGMPPAPDDWKP